MPGSTALEGVQVPDQDFAGFVATRQGRLLKFAMVLCGDYWLAEDVVANVLGRAFERWPQISSLADPDAYVRRMIVNEHISWRRKWTRTRPTDPHQLIEASPAAPIEEPSDAAELARRLSCLTPNQRAVIVLRFYENLSDVEIADVLGCRSGTVRTHASRALRSLRLDLDKPSQRADGFVAPGAVGKERTR
jgi:RNA polymerase sigma-70 factor (sigma-E family)